MKNPCYFYVRESYLHALWSRWKQSVEQSRFFNLNRSTLTEIPGGDGSLCVPLEEGKCPWHRRWLLKIQGRCCCSNNNDFSEVASLWKGGWGFAKPITYLQCKVCTATEHCFQSTNVIVLIPFMTKHSLLSNDVQCYEKGAAISFWEPVFSAHRRCRQGVFFED